jgi:acyl-CoA thioester hydrolase
MTAAVHSTASDDAVHVLPVTVYWEDTDAGGIVYYANYLRYAERGRTELLRAIGIRQREFAAETGIVFAVRRVEAEYLAPARLEDRLDVVTSLRDIGGASVDMEQIIRRDGEDLVRMNVRIVCVNDRGRATRLPPVVARAFRNFSSDGDRS